MLKNLRERSQVAAPIDKRVRSRYFSVSPRLRFFPSIVGFDMAHIIEFPGNEVYGVELDLQVRFALHLGAVIKTTLCFGPFDSYEAMLQWVAILRQAKKRSRLVEREIQGSLSRSHPDVHFFPICNVTIHRINWGFMKRRYFDPDYYIRPGDPIDVAYSIPDLVLENLRKIKEQYEVSMVCPDE